LTKTNRGYIVAIDQDALPNIEDQWSRLIAGLESAHTLKFLERAAIETTIFPMGHMVIDSALRGEIKCGLKPLLFTPQSCVYVRS
jgi:hypothetical protein